MKNIYTVFTFIGILSLSLASCKKEEAKINPQEQMLTMHTWVITEVYMNNQPAQNPPQSLINAKVKFKSTSPAGIIYLNGSQYPASYWTFGPSDNTKLIINPASQAQISANITKLGEQQFWLKFEKEVPFLGIQLAPSTELRMVPE